MNLFHTHSDSDTRSARRLRLWPALLTLALLFSAVPAAAEGFDFGLRGGVYTDESDAFVGVELLTRLGRSPWFFNPNFEYVFVDNGDLSTLSFDFHYDFRVQGPVYLWAGGGPALVFRQPDRRDNETDGAFNLLAGIGFKLRGSAIRPYIQGKVILSDETESAIAFGVRF